MNITKALFEYHQLTKSQYEPSTRTHHELIINNLINAFNSIRINQLEKIDIDSGYKLITFLKSNTTNHNNSINKHIRFLRRVMKHFKIITSIDDLKLLPSDTKPFKRFYHDDLKLIIDYVKNMNNSKNSITYRCLIMLLLDSGVRIAEALSIKIENIDFINERIYLEETKTKKVRFAPFSNFSSRFIKTLIKKQPGREYLFFNFIRNRSLNKNDVKLFFRRLKEILHIDRIHTHRFRKTFGSMLVENGLPIEHLQSIYQHSRITTTMKYVQFEETKSLDEYRKYSNWKI